MTYRVEFPSGVAWRGRRIRFLEVDDFSIAEDGHLWTRVDGIEAWWAHGCWTHVVDAPVAVAVVPIAGGGETRAKKQG